MAKEKRGYKFNIRKLESLVEAVEELVPISNTECEWVWDRHIALYPLQDQTIESLKCKFQEMARAKIKTGDPNMPPHSCGAKRAYFAIVKKTDGSTCGGSDDSFLKRGTMTETLMRRKVRMEQESGVKWGAKEVILLVAGGRMTPGTDLWRWTWD
jgi:hypothetical protein